MEFEWDDAKERANRKKHRIDFQTASEVFLDPYVIEVEDRDVDREQRFNAIGVVGSRLLVVTYTVRKDIIRIISARRAEPYEKRQYHEI
jgi:uncharacterized protein